jgi:hypothetical protein
MCHWRREIALVLWKPSAHDWSALMPTAPDRHLFAQMSPGAWFSPVDDLENCTRIKYTMIFFARSVKSAGRILIGTIGHKIGLARVGLLGKGHRMKGDERSQSNKGANS